VLIRGVRMAAQSVDSSLRFPGLAAVSPHPHSACEPQLTTRVPDDGLGALRGFAFAALFEVLMAFAGFELWRLLR